MHHRISSLAFVLLLALSGAAVAQARWATYTNARYGTTADYPADLFTKRDPPPAINDGRTFRTADDRAQLLIYGTYNAQDDTPASYVMKNYVEQQGITYRNVTKNSYVVSGVREGKIFYERCNFRPGKVGIVDCVSLTYPAAEKAHWDAIVTRISRSLRAGKGID